MKSAGKARNNGLYRHIRTSKEIIRNLLNDYYKILYKSLYHSVQKGAIAMGERHTEEMRLLGLTIAFYRRARGLTQSELAEAVQISRTHMSNIEAPNSHTSLSLNKLMDIAEALEIPLKTLFDFKR